MGRCRARPLLVNMVKSKRETKPFRPPLNGQVLGFIARNLGLEISRSNKNASRYFNGRQVSDRARNEIIASLARDLVEQGIFPDLTVPNYGGLQFAEQIGHAIALARIHRFIQVDGVRTAEGCEGVTGAIIRA